MIAHWPVERIETEKRRLKVLAYLAEAPGYEAAADLLVLHCRRKGVPTDSDQMETCLAWLEEAALATVRHEDEGAIARVTMRGREVAQGHARHPGVLPPDP